MFRVTDGLMSAIRSLGVILLIVGLGMMFAQPAVADDPGDLGNPGGQLVPIPCSSCKQNTAPSGCDSNGGCYCFWYPQENCLPFGANGCMCQ